MQTPFCAAMHKNFRRLRIFWGDAEPCSSAGFQTCCIVGFQTRQPRVVARPADLEIGDTAGLETCATPPRCALRDQTQRIFSRPPPLTPVRRRPFRFSISRLPSRTWRGCFSFSRVVSKVLRFSPVPDANKRSEAVPGRARKESSSRVEGVNGVFNPFS